MAKRQRLCEKVTFNSPQNSDLSLTLLSCKRRLQVADDRMDDQETADQRVTLFLHSAVLKKHSDYFQALLSSRWSTVGEEASEHQPIQSMTLEECNNKEAYVRALELVYELDNDPSLSKQEHLFKGVQDATELFEAANRLQIKSLQEKAGDYIEAVPWTSEERRHVHKLCKKEIGTLAEKLRLRLSPAMLSTEFKEKFLQIMLKKGGEEQTCVLATDLISYGVLDCDMVGGSINAEVALLKKWSSAVKDKDSRDKSVTGWIQKLWYLTHLAIEAGGDVRPILDLMKEILEFRRSKSFYQPQWNGFYNSLFYQRLISSLRSGKLVLDHQSRKLVLVDLMCPKDLEDAAKIDIMAVVSTLHPSARRPAFYSGYMISTVGASLA